MFQIIPYPSKEPKSNFTIDPATCIVNEFFADDVDFTQLSDHYGIECRFEVMNEEGVSHVEIGQKDKLEIPIPRLTLEL